MRQRILMTLFALLILSSAFGQNFEKVVFNDKDIEDYYIQLKLPTEKINGVLILLPGYAENAESIFPSSNLFNTAYANDIWTIAIAGGEKIYADEKVIDKINRGLTNFIKRNPNVPKDKFVIGGFSAGGTISLRYAQYSIEHPEKTPIILKGVFTVDSPIDLVDIWEYFQRKIKKNHSEAGVFEARFISEKMKEEIGTPETHPKLYNELTPFNHRLTEVGNEKYLKDMAVRVYHDIDVEWQLKQRRRSLFDSNELSSSELINRLMLMGNERAEFMTAKQPGIRSNGMRHPHSWSIVDEAECIKWTLKIFDAK
ncbi:alpha/beta hydrolase [Cyclobacterium roseum]|uniref:alpha/beta hydrolase n=1 Tax=Cyclobacterium roseum TaxID=2666137 RepID=UPI0013920B78|nr:alpha/beta hydrolase [Cyclobacterium roseum]